MLHGMPWLPAGSVRTALQGWWDVLGVKANPKPVPVHLRPCLTPCRGGYFCQCDIRVTAAGRPVLVPSPLEGADFPFLI